MQISTKQTRTIHVIASGEYDVIIGNGLIDKVGERIRPIISAEKIAVVTDDVVDKLYSERVVKSLVESGYTVVKYVFNHGEKSKNIVTYANILNFLAANRLTRTDAVVALGGGVVGDMAGFAAATYLRGVKYVQVPTTLLAQIDSSVGGKTAIDLEQGKNLVGAFCQPSMVVCDVNTLKTLPQAVLDDGMGEAAKYAVLDKKIFNLVSSGEFDVSDLVYLSVDYKRMIVEADEFESGKRKLLNLGHTPAHGIEQLSGYTIPHGKAVLMGLKIILGNSLRHNLIDQKTYSELVSCIDKCSKVSAAPFSVEEICDAATTDKKRSGRYISLMMVYGVGDVREQKIEIRELKGYLQ